MDSQREDNSCQQCSASMTSSTARPQGIQPQNEGYSENVQQKPRLARTRATSNQKWQVHICPTTGGDIQLTIPKTTTVEELKSVIARKLKLSIDKINLLYKERILKSGALMQHGVVDGCKFTLLPNVETGLSTPKAYHHSIMQVLENLSDRQVNEFLAGRAPLTLAMKLGEHMMFVQLQLSSSPFAAGKQQATSVNNGGNISSSQYHHGHHHHYQANPPHHHQPIPSSSSSARRQHQYPHRQGHHYHQPMHPYSRPGHHHLHHQHQNPQQQYIHQNTNYGLSRRSSEETKPSPTPSTSEVLKERVPSASPSYLSKSPTFVPTTENEHLKNLLKDTQQNGQVSPPGTPEGFQSPPRPNRILTSPFDSPLSPVSSSSGYTSSSPMSDCSVPSSPEATTPDESLSASASRLNSLHQNHHHHCTARQQHKGRQVRLFSQQPLAEDVAKSEEGELGHNPTGSSNCESRCGSHSQENVQRDSPVESNPPNNRGAVIDSMYHVGRGIYSGTFSGTLNPTLQDYSGRPKRSLGTIVHILNDLLGVAPRGKVQVDSVHSAESQPQHTMGYGKSNSHRIQRPAGMRPLSGSHVGTGERPQSLRKIPQSPESSQRLEKENQVMKDKVEQVQMMLQQRRQRRKARREARASPYGWQSLEASGEGGEACSNSNLLQQSKEDVQQAIQVSSACEEAGKDVRDDTADGSFPSELKPEAVLV